MTPALKGVFTLSDDHLTSRRKPSKPYPEFPLFPHATGRWTKKTRGKMHYFGPWAEPDAALEKYLQQKDALHSGRTPKPDLDALTVKDVANHFLNAKQVSVDTRELSVRTWVEYKATRTAGTSPNGTRPRRRLGQLPPAEDRNRPAVSVVARDGRRIEGVYRLPPDAEGRYGRQADVRDEVRAGVGQGDVHEPRESGDGQADAGGKDRPGRRVGFYALRHTFRTIADEAKDQPAADHIMGHEAQHMATVYRESISDVRLKAVTDHVRGWLYALPAASAAPPAA